MTQSIMGGWVGGGYRLRVCGSLCFQGNPGGRLAGWRKEPGKMGETVVGEV